GIITIRENKKDGDNLTLSVGPENGSFSVVPSKSKYTSLLCKNQGVFRLFMYFNKLYSKQTRVGFEKKSLIHM
ncbi:MAG: hypothetical protein JW800_04385, partial [Candidatus Omnitrophica bacterium]|nr:hypothetical protein [Candidatus Omnitrophota bacterium]